MWPGQQPPGGEQNPQQNPYQQPGYPPPPPNQPPGLPPPGFPPPEPPRDDRQRRAAIGTVVGVAVAAAVFAGVLVITDKDNSDGTKAGVAGGSSQPSAPGPGASAPTGGTGGVGGGGVGGGGGARKLVPPAHSSGPGGTTVVIGAKSAGHTLDVYEDLRCPPCAQFEQKVGSTLRKDITAGKYQASFHFATFLDKNLGGSGSRNALSALGAALNVSTDAFLDYKAALLSAGHHPGESKDSFADDGYLLTVAEDVPSLKDNAAFRRDVRGGTYNPWAREMATAFDKAGISGTPTVRLDGSRLSGSDGDTPLTPAEFSAEVNARLGDG